MRQPNVRQRRPDLYEGNPKPCPRCLVWVGGESNKWGLAEMIQPLPNLAPALARDGSGPCCPDCQSADTMHQIFNREPPPRGFGEFAEAANTFFQPVPFTERCSQEERGPHRSTLMTWRMCRVAVGNDRRDQYRLPGLPQGFVFTGLVAASAPGELERHHAWMDEHDLWPEGYE
jgi:hypothetical protein